MSQALGVSEYLQAAADHLAEARSRRQPGPLVSERFALKGDAPAAHLHRRRQQANDRAGGHGLAAARLAHQRNDLAGSHVEAEVIDGQRTVCTDPNL